MAPARKICFGLAALTTVSAATAAGERISVAPFEAVTLEVPGQLLVTPGRAREVRIIGGDVGSLEIVSDPERGLRLRCRTAACPNLRLELVTPSVIALGVKGNGSIQVRPGFAPHKTIVASVDGRGQVDTRAIDAVTAVASATGGGRVLTRASSTLVASAKGGGHIVYSGAPRTVVQQGGDVRRADTMAKN